MGRSTFCNGPLESVELVELRISLCFKSILQEVILFVRDWLLGNENNMFFFVFVVSITLPVRASRHRLLTSELKAKGELIGDKKAYHDYLTSRIK